VRRERSVAATSTLDSCGKGDPTPPRRSDSGGGASERTLSENADEAASSVGRCESQCALCERRAFRGGLDEIPISLCESSRRRFGGRASASPA
jgi:hypothetical protein